MSVEQYPFLAPPNIRVTANYPGASAEAVEQSVATPIEQEVNGVDRLIYMKSSNTSDGRMQLDVNFEVGTDQDIANVLTQNRVSAAQARLPVEVTQQGVTVKKQSPSILMLISIYSPTDAYDANFLINYAGINLRDQLLRIPGIAQVDLFGGTDYGMRIWFRPDRLAKLGLTPADVINAIKEQNLQAPTGKVGAAPTPKDQQFTNTVSAPGRLVTPEEFENIIVRQSETGAVVRIKDIGRAELGSQDYNAFGRLNGKPAGAMAVYLLPGANQLKAAETIYATMERAKAQFPPGMDYKIVYDTTPAVEASIESIVHTFVEALILVTLVVFIFLQNIRATIIPLITIPVSLIGTFIFFPMLGFSVNTLSMFGLVLAIGIVVDDAIVVVEAVIHHLEHGMSPKEATIQAMKEVTAPVIGIALILSAVFIPVAMLGGLVGSMYKQFALTIAISVLLSAFNALSLTPALCAMLLKPPKPMRGPLGSFFKGFNKAFDVGTKGYVKVSRLLVRRSLLTIGIVVAVAIGASLFARVLPAGFIPDEDQGIFGVNVQLPAGASLERTSLVLKKIEDILAKTDGLDSFQTIGGYGAVTNTFQPNYGTIFVRMKPWDGSQDRGAARQRHHGRAAAAVRGDPRGGDLPVQHPDAVRLRRGVGLQLPAAGPQRLADDRAARRAVAEVPRRGPAAARAGHGVHLLRPELPAGQGRTGPREGAHARRAGERGLPGAVDRRWAAPTSTTSTASGGCIASTCRPTPRPAAEGRGHRQDLRALEDHQRDGAAVDAGDDPRCRRCRADDALQPAALGRESRAHRLPASPPGQALAALEQVFAETMPAEMGFAFSSMSYQEKIAPPAGPTFIMAIVCVFLLLAALYESWRLPWAVLLGSPLVALGAFFGVWLMGFDNNVYVQIGLVMLIGLAAKNAILIVEFAKAKHEEGASLEEAALESARLRFRPILMTAFAFILGVVPLMLATGAGAGAQNVMGTGVFWGMLVATALGVFIIPGNYTFVEGLGRRKKKAQATPPAVPAGQGAD